MKREHTVTLQVSYPKDLPLDPQQHPELRDWPKAIEQQANCQVDEPAVNVTLVEESRTTKTFTVEVPITVPVDDARDNSTNPRKLPWKDICGPNYSAVKVLEVKKGDLLSDEEGN